MSAETTWLYLPGGFSEALVASSALKLAHDRLGKKYNVIRRAAAAELLAGHPGVARIDYLPEGASVLNAAVPDGEDRGAAFRRLLGSSLRRLLGIVRLHAGRAVLRFRLAPRAQATAAPGGHNIPHVRAQSRRRPGSVSRRPSRPLRSRAGRRGDEWRWGQAGARGARPPGA